MQLLKSPSKRQSQARNYKYLWSIERFANRLIYIGFDKYIYILNINAGIPADTFCINFSKYQAKSTKSLA